MMASRQLSDAQRAFARRMAPPVSGQGRFTLRRTLFHYTAAGSFHNIVTSGVMWATNFSFLNDPSEINYGLNLVREHLSVRASHEQGIRRAFLEAVLGNLRLEALPEVYVCCFTGREDDLSQWRAYGNAATARYSIGFDAEELRDRAAVCEGATLGEVIYDRSVQVDRLANMTARALHFITDESVDFNDLDGFAATAASQYAALLPLLKSDAFSVEQELRVIIEVSERNDDRVRFDTARGTIKPFIPLPLATPDARIPIRSVHVLAPARPDAAVKAAALVLRAAGVKNVQPAYSKVPFAE